MSIEAPKRIEGQIWIDKNSPYRLKYYVNGQEYTVEVSGNYVFPSSETLYCGTVVKLSTMGWLMKAKFPEDISDILGIVASTVVGSGTSGTTATIPITKNGWIKLLSDRKVPGSARALNEITAIFADHEEPYWTNTYWDINPPSGSSKPRVENLLGAPVYWCLDSNGDGKLTLKTPSGFYWRQADEAAQVANISYYNLPQIGNISKIETENNRITSIEIHVNFSKFDSSLEWSYPAVARTTTIGKDADYNSSLVITHGFKFPQTLGGTYFIPQTNHNITYLNNNVENTIIAEISENYNQGTCTVITSNPYNDGHYRVTGEINFRIDMTFPSAEPEPEPEP